MLLEAAEFCLEIPALEIQQPKNKVRIKNADCEENTVDKYHFSMEFRKLFRSAEPKTRGKELLR